MSLLTRILLSLLLLQLAACSSMQPVNIESAMQYPPPPGVDFGSLVKVKTLQGRSAEFRVTEMTDDGLGGNTGFYRYEDMKSLRVQTGSGSGGDTLGIVLGALGIIALIALVANADSVSICSSTPCPHAE